MQKQVLTAFIRGLDGKTPKATRPLGTLDVCENFVIEKGGELGVQLRKRYGFNSISTATDTGASLSAVRKLKGTASELLLLTTDRLYSRSVGAAKWFDKGSAPSLTLTTTADVDNTAAQTTADCCYSLGYRVVAWEDSRGGSRYSVIDQATGMTVVNDAVLDANGVLPKLIASGTSVLLFYVDSGTSQLKVKKVVLASPQTLSSATTVATLGGSYWYTLAQTATDKVVFAGRTAANTYQVGFISSTLVAGAAPAPVTFSGTVDLATWLRNSYSPYLSLVTYASGGAMSLVQFDPTGLAIIGTTTIDAAPGTLRNITAYAADSTTSYVLYEVSAAATYNTLVKKAVIVSGTPTLTTFKRSVGLAANIFPLGSSYYVALAYDSATQPTGFVADIATGNLVARFHPEVHGGLTAKTGHLPGVWAVDSSTVLFANLRKDQLVTNGPTVGGLSPVFMSTGVNVVSLSNADRALGAPVEFASGVVVPSARPSFYDSATVIGCGFDLFPETPQVSQATGGSLTTTATYGYLLEYQYRDRTGAIHRSATSMTVNVTLTGSNNKVVFAVPTDRLTSKSNVALVVWRTAANGSAYFRESSISSPLLNDPTVDTITYTSSISDAALQAGEPLFTTLDPLPPPASKVAAVWKSRIWVGGTEDGRIYPSLELSASSGYSVMFNDGLARDVDTTLGPVTALHGLDDYLVIFHAAAIEVLSGDGPDANGNGAAWSVPARLPHAVGTVDADSVARTKDGLIFKSPKGWYLLTRSLDVVPMLGADDFAGLTVSGAVISDNADTVLWTTATGTTVGYDLTFGRFFTFTNQSAVAATKWQGVMCWVDSSGVVHQEVPGVFADDGAFIHSRAVFSFANVAGWLGRGRCYRIGVGGERRGKHGLRVGLTYNGGVGLREAFNVDLDTLLASTAFGTETHYGDQTPFGGWDGAYMFEVRPAEQRMTSLQVSVEDYSSTGDATAAFALTGIAFEVGLKAGMHKMAAGRRLSPS